MKNNIFAIFIAAFLLIATCFLVVAALNGGVQEDVEEEVEDEVEDEGNLNGFADDHICVEIKELETGDGGKIVITSGIPGMPTQWILREAVDDDTFALVDIFSGDELVLDPDTGVYKVTFALGGGASVYYIIDTDNGTIAADYSNIPPI